MSAIRVLRPRSALREQQRFIANTIVKSNYKLIVSAMGSGKTGATLTALRHLLDTLRISRVLIIAPLGVAEETWPDEIHTWAHTNCLSYAVCTGSPENRLKALAQCAEITIINVENLVWLWNQVGASWSWDHVIIDESSLFKAGKFRTSKTKRKRADGTVVVNHGRKMTRFGALVAARKYVKRIHLLTGTPAPNGVIDLWGQIFLMDLGERLGSNQEAFLGRWFDENKYNHTIKIRDGANTEILDRISDVMVSLPPLKLVEDPVYIPVKVRLPTNVMLEYRRFKRSLVSEAYDVEAVNSGVLTNKLLQFANGSMYREDRTVVPIHHAKLDALAGLIERAGGDNVLILYSFQFDLAAIQSKWPDVVVLGKTPDAVRLWNEGKIHKLAAHPKSCSHGLNLQFGGHIIIWYGPTWQLELWLQANARLPRVGQTQIVAIYIIMAEGTEDERVLVVNDGKAEVQEGVNQAVRADILAVSGNPSADFTYIF